MTHRLALLPLLLLWVSLSVIADETGPLKIHDARVPEGPPVAPVLAGYLVLENPGDTGVHVIGASSPDFAAVEIHEMRMHNGMMSMKPIPRLTIPAGGKVTLAPGGLHLMLIKPDKTFHPGDRIPVMLRLEDGRTQSLTLTVVARDGEEHHHHH